MRHKKWLLVIGITLLIGALLAGVTVVVADPLGWTWTQATSGWVGKFTNTGSGEALGGWARGTSSIATYGYNSGSAGQGVRGYNNKTDGFGVYGRSPYYIGVRGEGGRGSGDYGGYFTGYNGARAISYDSGGFGVWGSSYGGNGIGAYGYSSGTKSYGGRFYSANYRGLYANGASGWYDAYFPNFIYVGGKVYGTPGTSLVVKNQGGTVLHPSDLVRIAGFDPVGLDAETPTLLVAGTGGANAVGVVYGAYVHDEEFTRLFAEEGGPVVDPPVPEGEEPAAVLPAAEDAGDTLEADGWHVVEGPVQPGQYALMITEGFVQMNLSAAHPVEVGELLVTTPNGSVMAAAGPEVMSTLGPDQAIIGRALEPLETGSGKIWVYVSFR